MVKSHGLAKESKLQELTVIDLSQDLVPHKFAQLLNNIERFPMQVGGRLAVIHPKGRLRVNLRKDDSVPWQEAAHPSFDAQSKVKVARLSQEEAGEMFGNLQNNVDVTVFRHVDVLFDRLLLEVFDFGLQSWQLPLICKYFHFE
jgi:hypothetical protein